MFPMTEHQRNALQHMRILKVDLAFLRCVVDGPVPIVPQIVLDKLAEAETALHDAIGEFNRSMTHVPTGQSAS